MKHPSLIISLWATASKTKGSDDVGPFVIVVMVLFVVFLVIWFPFTTRRIDPWARRQAGSLLGCTIVLDRRGRWQAVGHGFGKWALVGLLHLAFIVLFWLGPMLLMFAAFLTYYWPEITSHR